MNEKAKRAKFEAYIGHYQSFMSYFGSYKRALDILIQNIEEKGTTIDSISYPVMFLARQCIELGLKANIRYFQKYSGTDNHVRAKNHYLKPLQAAFKDHILKTIENLKQITGWEVDKDEIKEFHQYFEKLDKLTDIFELLDKGSDAFRYPVNTDNKNSFEHSQTINILDVMELLEEVEVLLVYTASVFSKYTDYADEIEKFYEDQMRELNSEG